MVLVRQKLGFFRAVNHAKMLQEHEKCRLEMKNKHHTRYLKFKLNRSFNRMNKVDLF